MTIYKAYKFRFYPNREQKIMIDKTFGCTRFVFNKFLSERKEKYEENKIKLSAYDELKELTDLKKEKKGLKKWIDVNLELRIDIKCQKTYDI